MKSLAYCPNRRDSAKPAGAFHDWANLKWRCDTPTVSILPPDAVARKIIELANAGGRDPEQLCEGVLKELNPVTAPQSSSASRFTAGASGFLNFEPAPRSAASVVRAEALRGCFSADERPGPEPPGCRLSPEHPPGSRSWRCGRTGTPWPPTAARPAAGTSPPLLD
jgi:hypothetical protein